MNEALKNLGDRMAHPVDVSLFLSSAIPRLVQRGCERSSHGGRDGGSTWALSHQS